MYDEAEDTHSNKLFINSSVDETINEINNMNISLPFQYSTPELDFQNYIFPPNGELVTKIEEIKSYTLDAIEGEKFWKSGITMASYDESIIKYSALEGTGFFTSHSAVIISSKGYTPTSMLTFYFFTRSKQVTDQSKYIKYATNPEREFNKLYVQDKIDFLLEVIPKRSLLFIDGPLIGGDYYREF
jgi:hypothetical protein